MSFLSAAFLVGLPLLALPVAIHLFSRRRQEIVKWAAMQFLMDSSIRRRKIWRLDDLILMLLRTLAVLGIVLALARPLWHGSGAAGGMGRDVVFVWDVSLSMERAVEGDHTAFDRMLEKTQSLMANLGKRDTVRGLVTIGRGKWLTTDPTAATDDRKKHLVDELTKIGVTQASADWHACLASAIRAIPPREAKARLVVAISDDQAHGWRENDQAAWINLVSLANASKIPTAIELHNVIAVSASSKLNLAVDNLRTSRQLHGIGETLLIDAEVHNHGSNAVQQVSVDWILNGEPLGKSSFGPIPPGQSRQVPLKHVSQAAGIDRLVCRLDIKDDMAGDNERALIIETVESLPLLLIDDSKETDPLKTDRGYLLAALGHDPTGQKPSDSSVFRVTTVPPEELFQQTLSAYRAIVFVNTPDLDDAAVDRLMEFVRAGGGVWIALGDRTHVDLFNQRVYRAGAGLSPLPIEESKGDPIRRLEFLTVHPPENDHPATSLLGDTQRLDVDKIKIFQRFPFSTATGRGKVPVLLQSNTGEPLAIEGFTGKGRIIVQSMSLGVQWSNLPLTQAYVPLVHEWIWYLVQPSAVPRNLQAGDLLQAALPENEHVGVVQLQRPHGPPLVLSPFTKGDRTVVQSRDTQQPGLYKLTMKCEGKEDQSLPFQVARLAEESNLESWSPTLTSKWGESTALRLNPGVSLAFPSGGRGQKLGEPLWTTILAIVVVALIAELVLARRITAKRYGETAVSSSVRKAINRIFGRTVGMRGNQ